MADLDADAVEVRLDLLVEALFRLRVDVRRVRVEVAEHADQRDVEVLVLVQVLADAELLAGIGQQQHQFGLLQRLDPG